MAQQGLNEPVAITMADRHLAARRMRGEGLSDEEIALALNTDFVPTAPQVGAGLGDEPVDDGEAGFFESAGTTVLSGAQAALEGGSGIVEDWLGGEGMVTDALDKAAEKVGPSDERLERQAKRQEDMGILGLAGDAIAGEAPVLAGTVGAGALAGSVVPGIGTTVGAIIGAGYGVLRMYDQGRDNIVKAKVAEKLGKPIEEVTGADIDTHKDTIKLDDNERMRVAGGAAFGAVDAFPAGKILKAIAPNKVAGIAAKNLGKKLLTEGAKTGLQEGALEVGQELAVMALTDEEVRNDIRNLPEKDIRAIGGLIAEQKGKELAVAFLAGFGLGGTAGGVSGGVVQSRANAQRKKELEAITGTAQQRGIEPKTLEALAKDGAKIPELTQTATELAELNDRLNVLNKNIADAGTPEEKQVLTDQRDALESRLNQTIDTRFKNLGIEGFKDSKTVAAERKADEDNVIIRTGEDLDRLGIQRAKKDKITSTEDYAADTAKLAETDAATRDAANRLGNTKQDSKKLPERRKAYNDALEAEADARANFEHKYHGKDPAEAKQQFIKERKQADEAVKIGEEQDAKVQEFVDDYADIEDPDARRARAERVLKSAKKNPNKKLKADLGKARRKLKTAQDNASTPIDEIRKLRNEVTGLEARLGTANPAVVAAERVLQEMDGGPEAQAQPLGGEAAASKPSGDSDTATKAEPAEARPRREPAAEDAGETAGKETSTSDAPAVEPRKISDDAKADLAAARKNLKAKPGDPEAEAQADGAASRALQEAGVKDPSPRQITEVMSGSGTVAQRVKRAAAMAEPVVSDNLSDTQQGLGPEPTVQQLDSLPADLTLDLEGAPFLDLSGEIDPTNMVEAEVAMRDMTKETGTEIGAGYDVDGNPLYLGTNNDPNQIAVPIDDRIHTFTHTHPQMTPFSAADIGVMADVPSLQVMRVVTPGDQVLEVRRGTEPLAFNDIQRIMGEMGDILAPMIPETYGDAQAARLWQEAQMRVHDIDGRIEYQQPMALRAEEEALVNDAIDQYYSERQGLGDDAGAPASEAAGQPDGAGSTEVQAGPQGEEAGVRAAAARDIAKTADQEPEEGTVANPEKIAAMTKSVTDKAKALPSNRKADGAMDLDKEIRNKKVKQKDLEAAFRYAAGVASFEPTSAASVVLNMARKMYPTLKFSPSTFLKNTAPKGKKPKMVVHPDWKTRLNAAWQFLNRIGQEEGMPFVIEKYEANKESDYWKTYEIQQLSENPRMVRELGIEPGESARFTLPMPDPADTSEILRDARENQFSPEAVDRMRRTAEIMQSNTYKIDHDAVAAMTPTKMISGKKLAEKQMKYDDATDTVVSAVEGQPPLTEAQQKFLNLQEYRQKKKLATLRRMAREHGDQDVGFRYRVDNKGRIYADGSFTPQTGDAIKEIFIPQNVPALTEDLELPNGDTIPAGTKLSFKQLPTVDHSASGWQMASLMVLDEQGAGWFNLGPLVDADGNILAEDGSVAPSTALPTDPAMIEGYRKRDMYTRLMADLQQTITEEAPTVQNAAAFKEAVFDKGALWNRDVIKPGVIAVNYGGGAGNFVHRLKTVYADNFADVDYGSRMDAFSYAGNMAHSTLAERAPKVMEFQNWAINNLTKLVKEVEGKKDPRKATPTLKFSVGLDGTYQTLKPVEVSADMEASNGQQRVSEAVTSPGQEVDAKGTARSIFSQIIQGFDAAVLHRAFDIYSQANPGEFISSNHDSYTVPPGKAGAMAAATRQAMKEIFTEVGDAPARLLSEIEAQMPEGFNIRGLRDPNLFNEDGSFKMGDYDLDALDYSVPVMVENYGDAIPALTDTVGEVQAGAPQFAAVARGIDYEAADTGPLTGVQMDTSLPKAAQYAQDNQFNTGREFKVAMQEQALAAQDGAVDLRANTPEVADRLVDFLMEDAKAAAVNNQNAIGWYDRKVGAAKAEFAKLYPEIETDPEAEFKFIWALAVTSNGLKVDKNFELAADAYEGMRETGAFPKDIGIGQAAKGINDGLAYYDQLVEKMGGWEAARDFMVERRPVRDIEKISGIKVSKEGKGTELPGAVILGPKIGGGFFSNLYGNFNELTMDRWFTRTLGRWRGNLIASRPDMEAKKQAEIKGLMKAMTPAELKDLRGFFNGYDGPIRKVMSAQAINDLSMEAAKRSMDPGWRARFNERPWGQDLRKTFNSNAKYIDGQIEDPGGAKDREFIRGFMRDGLDRLRAEPDMSDLTMADLQALLWYPEKLLYDTAKKPAGEEATTYADEDAPDYENAARNLVRNRLGPSGPDGGGRGGRTPVDGSGGAGSDAAPGEGVGNADQGTGDQGSGEVDLRDRQADQQADTGGGQAVAARGIDQWLGTKPGVDDRAIKGEIGRLVQARGASPKAIMAGLRHDPIYFSYDRIMRDASRKDNGDYGPNFMEAHAKFTTAMRAKLAQYSRGQEPRVAKLYLDMGDAQLRDHHEKMKLGIERGTVEVADYDQKARTFRIQRVAAAAGMDLKVPSYMKATSEASTALQDTYERIKNPAETSRSIGQWIEDNFINRMAPVRRLEQNLRGKIGLGARSPFKLAEMAVNDAGRMYTLHYEGAADLSADGAYTSAEGTKGLREIFDMVGTGQDMVDWMSYMIARRAKDLKAKGIKTPLSDADIDAALAKEKPEYKTAAAEWKKHNDANIDFLVKTGRITKAQAKEMKADEFYVPFYRDMDEKKVVKGGVELDLSRLTRKGGGRGGDIAGGRNPGIHKMKGDENLQIDNLLKNMIRNSEAMAAAGMRNHAANKIFDMMEEAPGMVKLHKASKVDRAPKGAVKMWKDGVEYWVEPTSQAAEPLMVSLAGLEPLKLGKFTAMGAGIASIFRQGITLSPAFIIRNAIRGAVSAGVHTSWSNVSQHSNTLRGLRKAYRKDDATKAFMRESGMGDYSFGGADTGFGKDDILIEYGLAPKTAASRIRQFVNKMEEIGTATELADRVAAYETMVANGVPSSEASWQAQNIINYGRKGGMPELRAVLSMLPFLNARIQGLARIAEGATDRKATPMQRRQAFQQMALAAIPLMVAGAAMWAWNNSDEERREKYKAEPLWRRQNYHIVYAGDKTLLIPKAFEIGHIFSTLPEMMADALVNDMGDEVPTAVTQLVGQTLLFNAIPAAALPAVEAAANYSFFTGQPIVGQREQSLRAADRTANASSFAKFIGRTLGVSDLTKISPTMIEHVLQGYGGAYYHTASGAMDTVGAEMGIIPSKPGGAFGDVPVASNLLNRALGSMVKDTEATTDKYLQEFYENKDHITQIYRSAKSAAENGNVEYARDLLEKASGTAAAYKIVNKAGAQMSKLNGAIREIQNDRTLSAGAKREALKPLVQKRNLLSRKVAQIIDKLEEKQGTTFKAAA